MLFNLESEIAKNWKIMVLKQLKYRTLKRSVVDAVSSEIKKTKDMKGRGTDITKEKVPRQQKQSPTLMNFHVYATGTGDPYPSDVCQAQVARADTKEWEYEKNIKKIERELNDTKAKLHQAKKDKTSLEDKMRKMAKDKLTHKNPVSRDMTDPNQTQKLAAKYGELYENEWIDAMHKLYSEKGEREKIDLLSAILKFCYSECERIADSQLSQLELVCFCLQSSYKQQEKLPEGSEAIKRNLLDAQHGASNFTKMAVVDIAKASLVKEKHLKDKAMQILLFTESCIEICWSMVTRHPRIFLFWPDVSKEKKINFEMFQAYTRSGDTVEYGVWPAMLLYKDGPLLRKGTVQPVAR
ncbi:uncharacterized protein LOC110452422 isoform X2 [Mizuhopecten yessoensis]|nr:uncharacterized protein LOC110452422 isoform X2 [Mizuhopecten yessoensis]